MIDADGVDIVVVDRSVVRSIVQIVRKTEVLQVAGIAQLDFYHPILGSYPYSVALLVKDHIVDDLSRATRKRQGAVKVDQSKFIGFLVVYVQAVVGPHPQLAVAVFGYGVDPIVAYGSGIVQNRPEYIKLIAVVAVESVYGTEPQEALPVLEDFGTSAARQALGSLEIFKFQGIELGTQRG